MTTLRKAMSAGGVKTAVSLVVSFLSVKITSVYLGPVGVGVLGQMQYLIAMASGIVVAGLSTALVRRTAELGSDPGKRAVVVSTTLKMVLLLGVPAAAAVLLMSDWLSLALLHDPDLRIALIVFGVVYLLGVVGALYGACANGARDYRSTVTINISVSIATLALLAVLSPIYGLVGALVAIAVAPLFSFVVGMILSRRSAWWPKHVLTHPFSNAEARRALAFIPAAAVTAVAAPLMHIVLRNDVVEHSGLAAVGLLQGVTRLSDLYLGIVISVLGMYFLPRFAEIKAGSELRRELIRASALIIPGLALASLLIYLLRDVIIAVLFTREFAAMRDLFGWQMTGNVLKMMGWLLGMVVMAKANPLLFAVFDALALFIWWQLGSWLILENGAVGATQAYALTYAIYVVMGVLATIAVLRRMPT
jgi:O-antigen/teichoic acid export membrane protein